MNILIHMSTSVNSIIIRDKCVKGLNQLSLAPVVEAVSVYVRELH